MGMPSEPRPHLTRLALALAVVLALTVLAACSSSSKSSSGSGSPVITMQNTAFNVTGVNTANWQRPTSVQSARCAKFYLQFDF